MLGFLLFFVGPTLASFYLSLTSYAVLSAPRFQGLVNYERAFGKDPLFWTSLGNTIYYAGLAVPLSLVGALGCAVLLNQNIKARAAFRTMFFLPSITPIVASTLLWTWILNPDYGLLNYLLESVGINGPKWLGSPEWSKPSLVLMHLWAAVGGSTMIIFLAALQAVPQELHESASIDGAGAVRRFFAITVPLLTPAIFLNLIVGLIAGFRVFTVALVATNGGPFNSTLFYMLHVYNNAFQFFEMGYASALAWIFTVIVLLLAWVQFGLAKRWVYYAGQD